MNRIEAVKEVREKVLRVPLEDVKKSLSKDFYNMDKVVEALYYGITAGKNIILYGPGGFGKTQIVKKFLEALSIASQTIVGNEDTEVDALLGIPNIKKLTEESIYEIAFENTVFRNKGVLILEEFLDVRPTTAAALKDVLSEGGMRQGDTFIESLISSVVICTNRSPEEMSIDNSTSAFYKERFPIRIEVTWNDYTTKSYIDFLKLVREPVYKEMSSYYEVLAEIAARTSEENIVSPRVVLDAADMLILHKDIKVLQYVDGLNTLTINEIVQYCRYTEEKLSLNAISDRITQWIIGTEVTTVMRTLDFITELEFVLSKLSLMTVENPNNSEILIELIAKCRTAIDMHRGSLHGNISKARETYLTNMLDDKVTILSEEITDETRD